MTSAALAGSTGLVGSHILSTLLSLPSVSAVHAYSRRELPAHENSSKLHPLTSTDTSTWPSLYPKENPPKLFLSGLGTTRAAAGGTDKQYEIDYTLNLNLAKAAKEAGASVYVLISSGGASSGSMMFYARMKGELEDEVKKLGFDHTVILRPGLIVGTRQESRMAEGVFRGIAMGLGKVSSALKDPWAQDADVIAKAAVRAGLDCVNGKREKGVWLLGQGDIVNFGRTEWKE
jgi:uncharacterized protein YbjT (DUF2867 family)